MSKKKIFIPILVALCFSLLLCSVSATTYSFSNSTNSTSISKMVSGDLPMKNGKFIKTDDVVKFKSGKYYELNLIVKKRIKITTTTKGKVYFIGNTSGTGIQIKAKKVKINGIRIYKYDTGISGKTTSSYFTKLIFKQNKNGILINGSKNTIISNKFNKNTNKAIAIKGSKNKIQKNSISNSKLGVEILGYKNIIHKNKLQKNNKGLLIYLSKNKAIKNTIKYSKIGIDAFGMGNTLESNKIYYSKSIGILYQDETTMKNNYFKKNKINKKHTSRSLFE